jgi:hypothetical protein
MCINATELASDQVIHLPRRWAHLEGPYQAGRHPTRVVEEILFIRANRSISITTSAYGQVRSSSGGLRHVAELSPTLVYDSLWTYPQPSWASDRIESVLEEDVSDRCIPPSSVCHGSLFGSPHAAGLRPTWAASVCTCLRLPVPPASVDRLSAWMGRF